MPELYRKSVKEETEHLSPKFCINIKLFSFFLIFRGRRTPWNMIHYFNVQAKLEDFWLSVIELSSVALNRVYFFGIFN